MNKCTVASAIMEMARVMDGQPMRRAYSVAIDENGLEEVDEVPLGTEGAEVWATVETRWPLGDDAEIEWVISDRDEAFEKRRKAAVKAAREIAERMIRGEAFIEARSKVLDHTYGVWDGDLPNGWSWNSAGRTPWWLI